MSQNVTALNDSKVISAPVREVLIQAFAWMFGAMILATIGALLSDRLGLVTNLASSGPPVLTIVLFIAWLIFSLGFRPLVQAVPAFIGAILLVIYALGTGVLLAPLLKQYTTASLALAFGATTALFGSMVLLGLFTKMDLRHPRFFIWAGLAALVIFGVINLLFIRSEVLEWLIAFGMIALFSISVASTVQNVAAMVEETTSPERKSRLAIVGAAAFFTSFLNIFLRFLRASGQKR
ncbi:MAG: Bax inhibitor-1 family protein [Candidatus Brachytrichaceae bacterium NZ_4S206]|jgi:FtsH-binding integral membrane protein